MAVRPRAVGKAAFGIATALGVVAGCAASAAAMRKSARLSVALLFDAENVPARCFPKALDAARRLGRVTCVRAYGPAQLVASSSWGSYASSYGVQRVVCEGCRAGKNSSDIQMAIDAMDLFASGVADAYVIVSDDSDFAPLAKRLREAGKWVMGVGWQSRNGEYQASFDEFVIVGGAANRADSLAGEHGSESIARASLRSGVDRLTLEAAVRCAEKGARGGWCLMSDFGTLIREERPTFSPKNYGCKNTTSFVVKTGMFDITGSGNGRRIRPHVA